MEAETQVAARRRRRSSLFVERRSCIYDESDDSHATPAKESTGGTANVNVGEIQNYISNTKQCYKNWKNYVREMKSKLEAAHHVKPLQYDDKTLMEFLTVEDRSLLKEAETFVERRYELTKLLASAASRLEAAVDEYEFNKRLFDGVIDNLTEVHQTTAAKAVDDYEEMVKRKFGKLGFSCELPVSQDAAPILVYDSDTE